MSEPIVLAKAHDGSMTILRKRFPSGRSYTVAFNHVTGEATTLYWTEESVAELALHGEAEIAKEIVKALESPVSGPRLDR